LHVVPTRHLWATQIASIPQKSPPAGEHPFRRLRYSEWRLKAPASFSRNPIKPNLPTRARDAWKPRSVGMACRKESASSKSCNTSDNGDTKARRPARWQMYWTNPKWTPCLPLSTAGKSRRNPRPIFLAATATARFPYRSTISSGPNASARTRCGRSKPCTKDSAGTSERRFPAISAPSSKSLSPTSNN
jgi:hypothetical protein